MRMNETVAMIAAAGPFVARSVDWQRVADGVAFKLDLVAVRYVGDTRDAHKLAPRLEIRVVLLDGDLQAVELKPVAKAEWDGRPPNPEESGAHWLRAKGSKEPVCMEWSALSQRWAYFGVSGTDEASVVAAEVDYIGQCTPPS
jgi:hypothetical protein